MTEREKKQTFPFVAEPRGDVYRALLRAGLASCKTLTLVERHDCNPLSSEGRAILGSLDAKLTSCRTVAEWPGTVLPSATARLHEYTLCDSVLAVLEDAATGLFDWCQPKRPEDPILWRVDGSPWLVTIADERHAELHVTEPELASLLAQWPVLKGVLGGPTSG